MLDSIYKNYLKINLNIDLNVKPNTVKLLEVAGGNLCDFRLGKNF